MNRPYSESYWLRGFNDGRQGKHEVPPEKDGPYAPANRGYRNGYRAGMQKFNQELMDKLTGRKS